jgi:hypothetical protein
MANDAQRARRRAQRETAARVKAGKRDRYQPGLPRAIRAPTRAARESYANDVIAGRQPYPEKGSREANNLGSLASKARWGKADPAYEKAFSQYWYHIKDQAPSEADDEDNADRESSADDSDSEED